MLGLVAVHDHVFLELEGPRFSADIHDQRDSPQSLNGQTHRRTGSERRIEEEKGNRLAVDRSRRSHAYLLLDG